MHRHNIEVTRHKLTFSVAAHLFNVSPQLDEQLMRLHELTRLTELGARLRYFTCELLERALAGLFPSARLRPFGSSANGFGRFDCDVDLVLELAPERAVKVGRTVWEPTGADQLERTEPTVSAEK